MCGSPAKSCRRGVEGPEGRDRVVGRGPEDPHPHEGRDRDVGVAHPRRPARRPRGRRRRPASGTSRTRPSAPRPRRAGRAGRAAARPGCARGTATGPTAVSMVVAGGVEDVPALEVVVDEVGQRGRPAARSRPARAGAASSGCGRSCHDAAHGAGRPRAEQPVDGDEPDEDRGGQAAPGVTRNAPSRVPERDADLDRPGDARPPTKQATTAHRRPARRQVTPGASSDASDGASTPWTVVMAPSHHAEVGATTMTRPGARTCPILGGCHVRAATAGES